MAAILDIANLDFAYGDQLVLKHISLPVEAGSVLGIIGPNGGGKTTLIRLILGLLYPTRGTISIAGLSPRQAIRQGNILGYLPQNLALPENFPISVRQLALLGLTGKNGMLRPPPSEDTQFVDWLLERVGVREMADRPIGSISGGQRQRALIARALAAKPKILLLDEPTTGIDRSGQQRFIEFLQDLKKDLGLTIVLVSHDLRAVSSIADRIACLNVTLHYHDRPEHMPADLVYRMFACDLEAAGVNAAVRRHSAPETR